MQQTGEHVQGFQAKPVLWLNWGPRDSGLQSAFVAMGASNLLAGHAVFRIREHLAATIDRRRYRSGTAASLRPLSRRIAGCRLECDGIAANDRIAALGTGVSTKCFDRKRSLLREEFDCKSIGTSVKFAGVEKLTGGDRGSC